MFAACFDFITFQQFQNTGRSGRNKTRKTDRHTSHVDRMESVNIFTVIDRLNNLLLWNMFRKRKLHNETVYIRIVVQFVYPAKQLFFGHIVLIANQRRFETDFFTSFYFTGHVGFTSSIMTYQNSCQVGNLTSCSFDLGDFFRHLFLHLSRDGFSVQ